MTGSEKRGCPGDRAPRALGRKRAEPGSAAIMVSVDAAAAGQVKVFSGGKSSKGSEALGPAGLHGCSACPEGKNTCETQIHQPPSELPGPGVSQD